MGELRKLANAKIEAEQEKLLALLPGEIEALKRKNAPKGLLRSGNTILGVVEICTDALDSLGKTVIEQYRWAIAQSLLASQSWVEELVSGAPERLQPLLERCTEHVTHVANFVGAPNLAAECAAKLEAKVAAISNDIALSLRSSFAERKRGLVRSLVGSVGGWLSKLIGVGKP